MLNVIPVLIGLLLGLLGGGGTVLAVPALIYFYGLETKTAITASLLVVGISSWLLAFGVGIITGLVGVGGGFLLVPSLHYFLKLPLRSAIETSLVIIALQSMSAFLGYVLSIKLDYSLLLPFILWVLVGIFIGQFFRNKINESWLKKSFGILLVVLGLVILLYNYN
jgi:uncharacterized membrane protein YfcA